jgi:hypothetical protein
LKVSKGDWPGLLLVACGTLCPVGKLLGLKLVFLSGIFLQTSFWLHPYETSYRIEMTCHYANAPDIPVTLDPRLNRDQISIHFMSYLLMVADVKSFFPLDPYLRYELCRTGPVPSSYPALSDENFTMRGLRCPPGAVSVSSDTQTKENANGGTEHFHRLTSCLPQ